MMRILIWPLTLVPTMLLLLATPSAIAQDAVDLSYRIPEGHVYRFEDLSSSNLDMQIRSSGQSFQAEQTSKGTMRGTARVLEVREGLPSVVLMIFDDDLGQESTSFGQAQPKILFVLSGRTVRVTIDESGAIEIQPADDLGPLPMISDSNRNTVQDLVVPDPNFPPPEPVRKGSRWTAKLDQDEAGSQLEMDLEVLRFTEVDGVRVAELSVKGRLDQTEGGNRFAANVSGTILVDIATGLPIRSELRGPLTTSATIEQGGQTFSISGSGTISQTSSQSPVTEDDTPVRDGFAPTEPKPGSGADAPPAIEGWSNYTEPISGARFQHPEGWRIQSTPQGLVLIPGGHDPGSELIVASGMEAGGVTDATDRRVGEQLDATVRMLAPMLSRTGPPESLAVFGGNGAVYRYAGTMPDGRTAECVSLVRIGDGLAMGFSILAAPERISRRVPTLERMLATLHVPKSMASETSAGVQTDDRRLIGMFGGEAISGGGDAGVYVNTQLVYALGSDGIVLYGARSAISASQRDYTGELEWAATGETSGSVQRGRWSAADGMLRVAWDAGGRSVFAYGFEPDGSLVLRDPRTRELINFFRRIR